MWALYVSYQPQAFTYTISYEYSLGNSGAKCNQNDLQPRKFLFLSDSSAPFFNIVVSFTSWQDES